jgi:DNA-binding transcriptional MerR regulator
MDIGKVRAATGMTASTLHHYEQIGLIESIGRVGLRRQYDGDIVDRLAVIALCQRSGFNLAEIRGLMLRTDPTAWRDLVATKMEELDLQIARLRTARTGLEHALSCPNDDIMRCEHFQGSLRQVFCSDPSSSEPAAS